MFTMLLLSAKEMMSSAYACLPPADADTAIIVMGLMCIPFYIALLSDDTPSPLDKMNKFKI